MLNVEVSDASGFHPLRFSISAHRSTSPVAHASTFRAFTCSQSPNERIRRLSVSTSEFERLRRCPPHRCSIHHQMGTTHLGGVASSRLTLYWVCDRLGLPPHDYLVPSLRRAKGWPLTRKHLNPYLLSMAVPTNDSWWTKFKRQCCCCCCSESEGPPLSP